MIPPFDDPYNAGNATTDPGGPAGADDGRPPLAPTTASGEWVVQTAPSPRQSVLEFHRRLLELTPRLLVTQLIVAANLIVFALMAVSSGTLFSPGGEALIQWGANFGPKTLGDEWWRALTSMFVHVGIIHVGLNMWVLWDAGRLVERMVGNVGFLVLYVISGLSGSLASVLWNPHVLSAGASGAVFGVFGALMGFIMLRGDSIPKSILGPLQKSGFAFLGYNLVFGFAIKWIDNAAHIGGLAAGLVCGVLMSHPLDRVTGTSRAVRNGLTAALGAIGILLAMHIAPEAPGDALGKLAAFSKTEKSVLDALQSAQKRWGEKKEISDDEFMAILKKDVIGPWRKARRELDQLNHVAPDQQELVGKLRQYVKAREESWEALLAALRESNVETMRDYARKKDAADKLLDELNSM